MNFKKLKEKRAELQKEMQEIIEKADTEERAMNEDETKRFCEIEEEIKNIDSTLQIEQRAKDLMHEEKPQE